MSTGNMNEYLIAKGVTHAFLNNRLMFCISDLSKSIINEGGIIRIAPCVTIIDYLRGFEKNGLIALKEENGDYMISVRSSA